MCFKEAEEHGEQPKRPLHYWDQCKAHLFSEVSWCQEICYLGKCTGSQLCEGADWGKHGEFIYDKVSHCRSETEEKGRLAVIDNYNGGIKYSAKGRRQWQPDWKPECEPGVCLTRKRKPNSVWSGLITVKQRIEEEWRAKIKGCREPGVINSSFERFRNYSKIHVPM